MRELSVFVDESGMQEGITPFYLVTCVLHDQSDDIAGCISDYTSALTAAALPDIPFHATPLMRANDDYKHVDLSIRKRLFAAFGGFVRRLPIRYKAFLYKSKEFGNASKLEKLIRKDMVAFLVDNLEYFQSFDKVKIYYDKGQSAVSLALQEAFSYALAKDATVIRNSDYRSYRLSQVADFICTIELTAAKYEDHIQTETDDKFFGYVGSFKKGWLKHIRKLSLT